MPGRDGGKLRHLLVAAFLVAILGSCQGQVQCPRRCRACTDGTADCSQSRLTAPPSAFPADTRVINLEGNRIRLLGSRTFARLPSLEVLKVSGNRISTLANDAFGQPFPNLLTLDLTGNRIRRIRRRALHGMTNLRTLKLNRNRINSLHRVFHGTPNLYQLNLARNQIPRLGENDLAPLTTVHYVDLRSNRISTIHPRAFQALNSLRYLFLNNNPIVSMPSMVFGSQVLQMVDLSRCQLTAVPGPFPSSISDLRLNNNVITRVNHTDFLSITALKMLALNENQINFFADGALAHMQELNELWLRNNALVYIPRQLPDSLKRVFMDNNNVEEIESGVFSATSQMDYLSVQTNAINRISPNTFNGLRFLNTINLQMNELEALEPDTFVNLDSLATLMLSNNPLQRIDDGAFRNLGNLKQLFLSYITTEDFHLGYNFLPEMLRLQSLGLMNSPGLAESLMNVLNEGHLTPLSDLQSLDVSYNTLQSVPARVRELFPNLNNFPLDGNPLRCTEQLSWLQTWMQEASSTVTFSLSEEPQCNSPLSLQGRAVQSIGSDEWGTDPGVNILPVASGLGGGISVASLHGGLARDQPADARGAVMGTLVKVNRGRGKNTEKKSKQMEENRWSLKMILASGMRDKKDKKDTHKKRPEGKKFLATLDNNTKEDQAIGTIQGEVTQLMDKQNDRQSGPAKKRSLTKAKKLRRRGKKADGKRRRNGRKGKKGKKGNRRNRGRKERKNRKNRKNRERKRRRRLSLHTSRGRRVVTAAAASQ